MNIQRVYIGGWFQRTTLHLSELYDFFRDGTSALALKPEKLQELKNALELSSVELKTDKLEYISLTTASKVHIKICEDGLMVLQCEYKEGDDLASDIKLLTTYYEERLSPAVSYLFSLGAPVPKELANIKTIYPYFVVIKDAVKDDVTKLLASFGEKEYFEDIEPRFELYRGDKFYVVNGKGEPAEHLERFIEEQIFLREFKGQTHRYLNLHRIIWERIDEVKERGAIRGGDIAKFRDRLEGYAKTVNLIEARIKQMGTYLHTRERVVKDDARLKNFMGLIGYRYEAMGDTLAYMTEIWNMTKNYVNSGLELFTSLQNQATQNSVKNLTVVTSMGVGATLIGLFTTASVPKFTQFGILYFVLLALIGYSADKITKWFYKRKSYKIAAVDYDKDIK